MVLIWGHKTIGFSSPRDWPGTRGQIGCGPGGDPSHGGSEITNGSLAWLING